MATLDPDTSATIDAVAAEWVQGKKMFSAFEVSLAATELTLNVRSAAKNSKAEPSRDMLKSPSKRVRWQAHSDAVPLFAHSTLSTSSKLNRPCAATIRESHRPD